MHQVRNQLLRYAQTDLPVLITGPSGTGKEVAAQFLHASSSRQAEPFMAVNCGALTPSLVQSELFGHEKGAFTGASERKIGVIEAAQGGTLLLDEVGDLPLPVQVSLLRVLQEKKIERVGSTHSIPIDVRIVAATHVDLEASILKGGFREDLFYRLNVLPLKMPSLQARQMDILELARHYLDLFAAEQGCHSRYLSIAAENALMAHDWPGNIRELINIVRRTLVLCDSSILEPDDLKVAPCTKPALVVDTLANARNHAERKMVSRAMVQSGQNVTQAASLLGVSRMTLHRIIKKNK
jgi:DNA-binding NtrC family response regulator